MFSFIIPNNEYFLYRLLLIVGAINVTPETLTARNLPG